MNRFAIPMFMLLTGCAANFSGLPAPSTPVGTGLPRLDRPWAPRADPLPRSPNHRVLPATPEPGLWAADGAPRASTSLPTIEDVLLPYPLNATPGEKEKVAACATVMQDMIGQAVKDGTRERVARLPPEVLNCLVADLYTLCAGSALHGYQKATDGPKDVLRRDVDEAWRVAKTADAFRTNACREKGIRDAVDPVFGPLSLLWQKLCAATRGEGSH